MHNSRAGARPSFVPSGGDARRTPGGRHPMLELQAQLRVLRQGPGPRSAGCPDLHLRMHLLRRLRRRPPARRPLSQLRRRACAASGAPAGHAGQVSGLDQARDEAARGLRKGRLNFPLSPLALGPSSRSSRPIQPEGLRGRVGLRGSDIRRPRRKLPPLTLTLSPCRKRHGERECPTNAARPARLEARGEIASIARSAD